MSFAATWMEHKDYHIKLSKSDREIQISYDSNYMCNLKKNDVNELIYKTEIDSQIQKTNLWLPNGIAGEVGEIN